MSPEEEKAEEGFDLFIANRIYPEAELVFTADLKSLAQIKPLLCSTRMPFLSLTA